MRRMTVQCGCSKIIKVLDIEDDKPFLEVHVPALCPFCALNGGQYFQSPHWKERKSGKPYINPQGEESKPKGRKAKKRRDR